MKRTQDTNTIKMNHTINELVAILRQADADYYNNTSTMTDAQYDELRAELVSRDPGNEYLKAVGADAPGHLQKVKLSSHMGSQSKVNSEEEMLAWFNKAGGGPTVLSDKLDGSSVELTYRGGHLLRAVTRGDGEVGSDITANARKWNGLPLQIPVMSVTHIRGEAMLPLDVWEKHFSDTENPRNASNGTILRKSGDRNEHIVFRAFGLAEPPVMVDTAAGRFLFLENLGFMTPEFALCKDWEELAAAYDFALQARPNRNYEADGVIVELNSLAVQAQLGYSDGGTRPRGQVAWKFPSASGTSKVTGIILSVGHTGAIIPTACLEPVRVSGVTISNALLNNQEYIKELGVDVGDTVEVSRRGDVIPHVEKVLKKNSNNTYYQYPDKCPSCQGPLVAEGRVILCKNDDCPAQAWKRVMNWVKKLDIKDLGEKLLDELTAVPLSRDGVDEPLVRKITDLYNLTPDMLTGLNVGNGCLGGSLASKVCEEINRTRTLTVDMFMGSLGLKFLGRSMARKIGLNSPQEYLDISVEDLAQKEGMGPNKARAMKDSIMANRPLIEALVKIINVQPLPVKSMSTATANHKLSGKNVCFTGVRLKGNDIAAFEAAGCNEKSGVAAGLDILVCKDPNSTSSKMVKAKSLGVTIISLDDFISQL